MSLVINKLYTGEPDGTLCRCGAPIRYVHCPGCGSTNFYGKQSASIDVPLDGKRTTLRGFRCRRCDVEFVEGQPCEAPFFETETMRKRREKDEAHTRVATAQADCYKECLDKGMSQKEAEHEWITRLLKMRTVTGVTQ